MPHNSNVKMEDVGYKMKDDGVTSPGGDKNKMRYPSLSFNNKIPEGLSDKDVGDKCKIYLTGQVSSKHKDEYGEGLTIDVHSISKPYAISEKEYKNMSDEEKDSSDEKEVMGD